MREKEREKRLRKKKRGEKKTTIALLPLSSPRPTHKQSPGFLSRLEIVSNWGGGGSKQPGAVVRFFKKCPLEPLLETKERKSKNVAVGSLASSLFVFSQRAENTAETKKERN